MLTLKLQELHPVICLDRELNETSSFDFLRKIHATRKLLVGRSSRLVLNIDHPYLFVVSFFASLSLGKEIVLLPNRQSGTFEILKSEYDEVISDLDLSGLSSEETSPIEFSEEGSVVFFTSGSEGRPKKAKKRFQHLWLEVQELEKLFGFRLRNSFVLSTVTHQHIYGILFKILWPLFAKRTFTAFTVEYPEQLESFLKVKKDWTLISTPAFLKRYVSPQSQLPVAKAIFSSGGALDFSAAEIVKNEFGVYPLEIYGSTESGGVAYRERQVADQLWTAFPGVQISTNLEQQLQVCSPFFDEEILLMGDRAEVKANGFSLLGRVGDIVKIEEKRVSLTEISQRLIQGGLILDAVVVPFDEKGRQQIVCLAVLNKVGKRVLQTEGMMWICNHIRNDLRHYFDPLVLPRKFRFVEDLPYNAQSKLSRVQILEYFNGSL